eukprot:SAG22_NODE_3040_length_2000_cov_10.331931_2_plen_148_part_00
MLCPTHCHVVDWVTCTSQNLHTAPPKRGQHCHCHQCPCKAYRASRSILIHAMVALQAVPASLFERVCCSPTSHFCPSVVALGRLLAILSTIQTSSCRTCNIHCIALVGGATECALAAYGTTQVHISRLRRVPGTTGAGRHVPPAMHQ